MADDEEVLDEEAEEGEYNLPAIIIAVVVALALIGAGVWYFFLRQPPGEKEEDKVVWEPPAEGLREENISDALPQMIINPLDSNGRYFLILKLNVSLNDAGKVRDAILKKPWRLAQAQNIIYDICSSYRMEELRTPKVKEELRQQIKKRLNEMLGWSEEQAKGEAQKTGEEMGAPPIEDIYFESYIL